MRLSGRSADALREIRFVVPYTKYAEGSCLAICGDTQVLCTATVEEKVPPFLRNTGSGWVTAEYGMLPRATETRTDREATRGKQAGRTQEIQRLIGRSLRAVVDLKALGERQIKIDCDVIQADGGTRTAAICGGYVALHQALQRLIKSGAVAASTLKDYVAAISCGLYKGQPMLDLNYQEDSAAEVDANFVMTGAGRLVEVQGTAEGSPFSKEEFDALYQLAASGIQQIVQLQKAALAPFS